MSANLKILFFLMPTGSQEGGGGGTHRFLETSCRQPRPADPVSTPHRMFVPVLTVRLEGEEVVLKPGPSGICINTCATCAAHAGFFFFTCRLLVLVFDFLCREAGKGVIIKRVPHGLCSAVPRCYRFALVLCCVTRLGGAGFRRPTRAGKKTERKEKNERMM